MSDGIRIDIPGERTEDGNTKTYHISVDQALEIGRSIILGIASERINGREDAVHDHDTRRYEEKKALGELKDKVGWR